jgi:hypothetical protein
VKSTFLALWPSQTARNSRYHDLKTGGEERRYSGKRKRYTVKTQIMVNNQGLIICKTGHKKGHGHDYGIYKKIIL